MQLRMPAALIVVALVAVATACGGGGGSGRGYGGVTTTATNPPVSTQQVVRLALPTSAIGMENDPTFGMVGGFTQTIYSQVLGFAPGAQIMIENDQTATPHTFGDTGGHGSFPASGAALSTTAAGGSTISSGFQSGTINPGQRIGPFTLVAGTYY